MKQSFFTRRSLLILMVLAFSLSFIFMGTRRALRNNRNDVKKWLPDGFQETLDHAWFESHFPHEQFILMSWDDCKLGAPSLELMADKMRLLTKQPFKEGQPVLFKDVITAERLIEEIQSSFKSLDRQDIIDRLKGSLIGPDGKQTCLVVTLRESYHGEELAAAIDTVREVAGQCNIQSDELHLGGPPVDNAAIDYEGKRTLIRLAGWSAVIGLGISWLCFRSVRLTLMIFSCAIFSAGIGMAIVYFTGGMVDAILLSMPSLVYVLAMSSSIHIINYYHDAIRESGLEGAPEKGLSHGWVPCTVAAITTGLGLISLCYSNLIPIRNFGLYSALGVLSSLLIIFLVLPAFLHFWPSRKLAEDLGHGSGPAVVSEGAGESLFLKIWRVIGGNVIKHNKLVATACLLGMIFFAYGAATRTNTTISLMKLFSPEARILADYAWLEKHLGPLVPIEVILRLDDEKCTLDLAQRMRLARDIEEALEVELDEVGEALSAATFAPLRESMGKLQRGRLQRGPDRTFGKSIDRNRERFREYLSIDEENGQELWRISARVDALGDIDYGEFIAHLEDVVDPILEEYEAAGIEGISVTYTGLVPLIYKAQSELLIGLYRSLELAFVLIAVVMMLVLRSFSAGLLSMIPNLFPVVVIFGAMAWAGILIDVGTMMTASVALGVAVDDTVHYLRWFRIGLDQGYDRKGAAMVAYERCATAMSQTTLIAGLGLSVFALSTFTPTQRFGYMMLALLFAALFGDLIFLPALLSGPLGRFFDRGGEKRSHDHLPPNDDISRELPIEGGKHSPPTRHRYDGEEEVAQDTRSGGNSGKSPPTLPIRPKRVPRSRV